MLTVSGLMARCSDDPALRSALLLLVAVIFVNGWTDAPNAIATAVATRALTFRQAAALAAVCNFLGAVCTGLAFPAVAKTICDIVPFESDARLSLLALCGAMAAIVLWATAAWSFGIPTSESHALAAGLTGAAAALSNGFTPLQAAAWGKILLGLVLSTLPGFYLGRRTALLLRGRRFPRERGVFLRLQRAGAACMALLHGAQDGQKFAGIFLLSAALAAGQPFQDGFVLPLWLLVFCAAVMSLGTLLGGRRIVVAVGEKMVTLGPRDGCAADVGCGLSLLLSTLLGLPVSTTHARAAAILGAGSARGRDQVDWSVARNIGLAWAFTFPCCGLLGWLLTRILLLFL